MLFDPAGVRKTPSAPARHLLMAPLRWSGDLPEVPGHGVPGPRKVCCTNRRGQEKCRSALP
eukprot:15458476-Alexandrium_andersonii.AAC.1